MLMAHPTMDSKAWLFTQPDRRPWTRKMIERRVSRWGVEAKVPECHPHRFQHTCAMNLLENGADICMAPTMLDHEDLSTTALYTKVSDARLAGAVAALPSFLSTPKTHCVHGHARMPDDVLPTGGCRECGRTRQRTYRVRVAGPGVMGPGSAPATNHGEQVGRKLASEKKSAREGL